MTQQNSTEAAESKHSEMKLAAVFALIFSSLFLLGAKSATFTIANKCTFTIWPGILTGAGSPQVSSTGFQLDPQASSTLQIPSPWSGRVWARSQCTTDPSGKFTCATADCGSGQVGCNGAGAIPPATLVEFTLGGFNGKDFYDISLVDGFNMPVSVSPQGGPDGCTTTSCSANVNTVCPSDFAVKGSNGDVIACKSACLALNKPEYCCTGTFGTPDKCPPNEYSKIFKAQCPQAYSYAYDDKSSTFTCSSGANYSITFCP